MKNLTEKFNFSPTTLKWLITVTIMLVAILEVLDTTIVNVSLPDMMGSLGANANQITWVLTSYVVASAIFMPLTGFLENRLGRKNMLLMNIAGFMISSMLCGVASNLDMIIAFRVLQGAFGAALIPLSQAILRDTFPQEEQGKAMAIWGIGIMVAPILGPTIGGYITQNLNWRWIFYMNLPFCLIGFLLTVIVIKQTKKIKAPIDVIGLLLMATGIGCLQIMLDQGNDKGWFNSNYIIIMTIISIFSLATFIIRGISHKNNIINLRLFLDRNFSFSTILLALFCASLFGVMTVQPIMLEHLFNYPPITTGWVMAPRGLASAVGMAMVAGLLKRFGPKPLLIFGIVTNVIGTYFMSHYNLNISIWDNIWPGIIQGFGMGFFFVPLSIASLSTLDKNQSAEGAGLFGYGRMLGTSVGVSIVITIITEQTQINWNRLGGHINNFNANLKTWLLHAHMSLHNPNTIKQLSHVLYRHANMVAFVDAYWIIAIAMVAMIPFIFFMKKIEISDDPLGGLH